MTYSDYTHRTYLPSTTSSHSKPTGHIRPASQKSLSSGEPLNQPLLFTYPDRLLNFFEKIELLDRKGKINSYPLTPIPSFSPASIMTNFLNKLNNENKPLLFVLQMIQKEIQRLEIPGTSCVFQDSDLMFLLNQTGYLSFLFDQSEHPFPYDHEVQSEIPTSPPTMECIVTLQNKTQFIHLTDFLKYKLSISCKIHQNCAMADFKHNDGECVTLKLVTEEYQHKSLLAFDLQYGIANSSNPIPLIVRHQNPWEGLVLTLTRSVQPTDWIQYILQCTNGQRALCTLDESTARENYVFSLPQAEKGTHSAYRLIQACRASQLKSGDAFFTAALQFLVSTEMCDQDQNTFIQTVLEHLKTLPPVIHPTLNCLLKGCRNRVPFTVIQSMMEVAAIQAALRHASQYQTIVTRTGEKQCLRLLFNHTESSILLPFNPSGSLRVLMSGHLASHRSPETEKLFLELTECQGLPRVEDSQAKFILTSSEYLQSLEELDHLVSTRDPLLCHLALIWACLHNNNQEPLPFNREHLAQTLVAGLSPPMEAAASIKILKSLSASGISLPSELVNTLEFLLTQFEPPSGNIIKETVKAAYFKDDTRCPLIYNLWLEDTDASKALFDDQIDEGLLLFKSLLNNNLRPQAFKVLRILLNKTPGRSRDLLEAHIQAYQALSSMTDSTERDLGKVQLAYQLKNTLQRFKEAIHDKQKVPSNLSTTLEESIGFCTEYGENGLACDLFMLSVELQLFDEHSVNLKRIGNQVFRTMLKDKTQTPNFTSALLQFLVRHELWESENEIHHLVKLSEQLDEQSSPESVPYLALSLRLLDKELLSAQQKIARDTLRKKLVRTLLKNAGLPGETPAFIHPHALQQWIRDPSLLIHASMQYWNNNGKKEQETESILTVLYSLVPYDLYHPDDLKQLIDKTTKTLNTQPIDRVLKRLLVHQHLHYIKELVNQKKVDRASDFIRALDKWFDPTDWSLNICPILLKELPPSPSLLGLIEQLSNDQFQEDKAFYIFQLALDEMEKENISECVRFAETIAIDNLPERPSKKLNQFFEKLIPFILERSDYTTLAAKLTLSYVRNFKTFSPEARKMVELLVEKFLSSGKWQKLCRWIDANKEFIDQHLGNERVQAVLDKANPKNKGDWKLIISLIQSFPLSKPERLVPFLKSFSSSTCKGLETDILEMWLTMNHHGHYPPEILMEGWIVMMRQFDKHLTPAAIDSMLCFPVSDNHPNSDEFKTLALQTALKFSEGKKGKPTPERMRTVLSLYRELPVSAAAKFRQRLFENLIKGGMPADAIETAAEVSVQGSLNLALLPRAVKKLSSTPGTIQEATVRDLCTLIADPQLPYDSVLVKELACIPLHQTFKKACDLFCKRLDQLKKIPYRKTSALEVKKTLTYFLSKASSDGQLLEFERCLKHPFVNKHLKQQQMLDDYMDKLLEASGSSAPAVCKRVLEIFNQYSNKTEHDTPQYTERYARAVRLNLELLHQTSNTKEFKRYHKTLVQAISIQTNKIAKFSRNTTLTDRDRCIVEMSRDMAHVYTLSLLAEEPIPKISLECTYELIKKLLSEWLNYQNTETLNLLTTEYQEFFSLVFVEQTNQTAHLESVSDFFITFCNSKSELPANTFFDLYDKLNQNIIKFLSNASVETNLAKRVIPLAFNNLVSYIVQFEVNSSDAQRLFDSYVLTVSAGHRDLYPFLLTEASNAYDKIVKILEREGKTFFLETYLFLWCAFPSVDNNDTQNRGLIVENVLHKLYKRPDIHNFIRAFSILESSMIYLPPHHLESCGRLMRSWIAAIDLNSASIATFIHTFRQKDLLACFHQSTSNENKNSFYVMIFEGLVQLCQKEETPEKSELLGAIIAWTMFGFNHSIEPNSSEGYLVRLESISFQLERCLNFDTLRSALLLLKKLPNKEKLNNPDQQRKRAEFHFRLLTRAFFIDPDKSHQTAMNFLKYFSGQTAVFRDHETFAKLIYKTQK